MYVALVAAVLAASFSYYSLYYVLFLVLVFVPFSSALSYWCSSFFICFFFFFLSSCSLLPHLVPVKLRADALLQHTLRTISIAAIPVKPLKHILRKEIVLGRDFGCRWRRGYTGFVGGARNCNDVCHARVCTRIADGAALGVDVARLNVLELRRMRRDLVPRVPLLQGLRVGTTGLGMMEASRVLRAASWVWFSVPRAVVVVRALGAEIPTTRVARDSTVVVELCSAATAFPPRAADEQPTGGTQPHILLGAWCRRPCATSRRRHASFHGGKSGICGQSLSVYNPHPLSVWHFERAERRHPTSPQRAIPSSCIARSAWRHRAHGGN